MKCLIQVIIIIMFSCMLMTQSFSGEPANKSVSNDKKTLSTTMKQLADHLEFLGYKIEISGKEVKPYIIARHDINYNVVIEEPYPNFIYLRTYIIAPKAYSPAMTEFLNKAVQRFDITSIFVTEEKGSTGITLNYVALYTGAYSREIFGSFFDMYKKDLDKIRYMDNYENLFIK